MRKLLARILALAIGLLLVLLSAWFAGMQNP
jgi:hypothetical protein